jgi:hypothetical protein
MKKIILGLFIFLTYSCFSTVEKQATKNKTTQKKENLIIVCSNIDLESLKPGAYRSIPEIDKEIVYENYNISQTDLPKELFTQIHSDYRQAKSKLKQEGFYNQGCKQFRISTSVTDTLFKEIRYVSIQGNEIENHLSLQMFFERKTYKNKMLKLIGLKVIKGNEIPAYTKKQQKEVVSGLKNFGEVPPPPPPISE